MRPVLHVFIRTLLRPRNLLSALSIFPVIGTTLNLINQWAGIMHHEHLSWFLLILNFAVFFLRGLLQCGPKRIASAG